mgnify:CR=1 FL=1
MHLSVAAHVVALLAESVDRNSVALINTASDNVVALLAESVDRNDTALFWFV